MKLTLKIRTDIIAKGNKELKVIVKSLGKDLEKALKGWADKVEVKTKEKKMEEPLDESYY